MPPHVIPNNWLDRRAGHGSVPRPDIYPERTFKPNLPLYLSSSLSYVFVFRPDVT